MSRVLTLATAHTGQRQRVGQARAMKANAVAADTIECPLGKLKFVDGATESHNAGRGR